MAEPAIHPRPALAHAPLRSADGAFALAALPEGRLVHALAAPHADFGSIAERLGAVAGGAPFAVRPFAPGQWFVVGDAPLVPGELTRLAASLGSDVALSDQSHGRVRLVVEGPRARDVLARGTGLDLAPTVFAVGRSAQTLMGHVGTHVTRTAEDRFELIVLRSFAESLWDDLVLAAAAFLR